MTSILSRILPGPKAKSSASLEAARTELERRKGELAKGERAKADALSAATDRVTAALRSFEASGSAEDAEALTSAESALRELGARQDRTLDRLREAIRAHVTAIGTLEKEDEADALVAAFAARYEAHLGLEKALRAFVDKCPLPPELPSVSPEVRALALGRLDALPPTARRAVELNGFDGRGCFEMAAHADALLKLAEEVASRARRLGACAVAGRELEVLRAQVDAPNPHRITPAAE